VAHVCLDERALDDEQLPLVYYYPHRKVWRLEREFYRGLDLAQAVGGISHTVLHLEPFEFDMASVPRIVWPVVGPHELGIVPPMTHDWLYGSGGRGLPGCIKLRVGAEVVGVRTFTRAEADLLFLRDMERERVNKLRREVAYRAVRLFGGNAWRPT
jgi:hypothetical protein